jgi:hypothetical protein
MKNQFIPYEQALKLKALGFDEECLGYYDGSKTPMVKLTKHSTISAPLYQQAFRWFREKYNIEHNNRPVKQFDNDNKNREISFFIDGIFISNLRVTGQYTYEEAELACLNKLIEIVEQQKK